MAYIRILVTLAFLLQNALGDDRIKAIFEKYPDAFSADILLEVFELVTEFDDLLQSGYYRIYAGR